MYKMEAENWRSKVSENIIIHDWMIMLNLELLPVDIDFDLREYSDDVGHKV